MTLRQWAENFCAERGMFEEEARAVVDRTAAALQGPRVPWNNSASSVPATFLQVIAAALRQEALSWIEENAPLAWYKEAFQE